MNLGWEKISSLRTFKNKDKAQNIALEHLLDFLHLQLALLHHINLLQEQNFLLHRNILRIRNTKLSDIIPNKRTEFNLTSSEEHIYLKYF